MRLRNFLIAVSDIEKARQFYQELFGFSVLRRSEGNMILTDGLVLQDKAVWEECTGRKVVAESNSAELYFEDADVEGFAERLVQLYPDTVFVSRPAEDDRGRKVVRFQDPDGNLIEVGTPE